MALSGKEADEIVVIAQKPESTLDGKMEDVLRPDNKDPRIHPGLPTFVETDADPNIAFSDHVAIIGDIPLGGFEETLKILSLNTLGLNLSSGIHRNFYFGESLDEIKKRYMRIAQFLKKTIEENELDCILLQETELQTMVPILKSILGEDWCIEPSRKETDKQENGLITCYNTSKLKPLNRPFFNKQQRVLSQPLEHRDTGKIINLHNSWGNFSPNPRVREAEYKALLLPGAKNKNVQNVVFGDGNSRDAPVHNEREKIGTTSIPPDLLRKYDEKYPVGEMPQVPDYPDCAYYTDEGKIRRADIRACNFDTGKLFSKKDLEFSEAEWENPGYRATEYRLIMCLDDFYATEELIPSGRTLSEYELELKERADAPNIQVSMAANSRNEKALAIWCLGPASNFQKSLKGLDLPGATSAFIEGDAQPINVIFIPLDRIAESVETINARLAPIEPCDIKLIGERIDVEISRLRNAFGFALFHRSPQDKIDILTELKEQLSQAQTKYDIPSIYRRWENTERKILHEGVQQTKTHGQILAIHRNRLRGIFLDENEATTTSQFFVGLKAGPK